MDDPFAVRRLQAAQHLAHDVHRFGNWQLALLSQDLIEALALDVLHRDETDPTGLTKVEDANYVSICNLAGEDQFLLEPLKDFGIAGEFGPDHLEGDNAAQFEVFRFVDGTHAAFAESLQDLIAASDDCPGLKQRGGESTGGGGRALIMIRRRFLTRNWGQGRKSAFEDRWCVKLQVILGSGGRGRRGIRILSRGWT